MAKHNLISIDLAKNVFQVCGMTPHNHIVFNTSLRRPKLLEFMTQQASCEVVMEACGSSHHWARHFVKMGHTVKLLPAQHVTPFVRGNKSDPNDAIAIAEAARRPNILAVPVKSIEQQDIQSLHRIRERHVAHRTGLINQTRGILSEYGIIAPQGHKAFCRLLRESDQASALIKTQLDEIAEEYAMHTNRIDAITAVLNRIAKSNALCGLLMSIPGIGVINATAIYSAIGDGSQFKSAREFVVWLGLVPRQSSSGASFKSGGITKRGNRYLRKQLIHGARSVLERYKNTEDRLSRWGHQLVARRGKQKAWVAMAARLARIAWMLLHKREAYQVMV